MIAETKAVKDLEDEKNKYAVMYKGMIYRVQDISSEGSLKRLKLVSLQSNDITIVLWHPDSIVTCSILLTKRCLIIKHIQEEKFKIESLNNTNNEIELSKEASIQVYRWMIELKSVYIILYFCFDEMHIGSVYTLPNYRI